LNATWYNKLLPVFQKTPAGDLTHSIRRKANTMNEPPSPQAGKVAAATLTIGGMHCPACSARVVKALKAVPGVKEAEVSLEARQANVTYIAGETTPELLEQAITEAGYTFEGAAF
jgi:copper chaperone CopZ